MKVVPNASHFTKPVSACGTITNLQHNVTVGQFTVTEPYSCFTMNGDEKVSLLEARVSARNEWDSIGTKARTLYVNPDTFQILILDNLKSEE